MSNHTTDIVIIGAGPVGLFAVFQAGMLKMRAHVVDTLDSAGGQCSALYPEKPIYDIPGYPSILAAELIEKLTAQAAPFCPTYHLGQRVEKLEKQGGGWKLTTSRGNVIECKAVLIAAGCGAFGPNRPPLTGIEEYEGTSVFYLVSKREDFRNKSIVIAGGGIPPWTGPFPSPNSRRRFTSCTAVPNSAVRRNRNHASTRLQARARWKWWCPTSFPA